MGAGELGTNKCVRPNSPCERIRLYFKFRDRSYWRIFLRFINTRRNAGNRLLKKNPLFINKVLSFGKDQKNQKTNK